MAKSESKLAPLDELGSLHATLAKVLTKAINDGVILVDKEGNQVKTDAPAAILNVARQFLKDNKIEAIPVKDSPLGNLVDSLPFAGDRDDSNFDTDTGTVTH